MRKLDPSGAKSFDQRLADQARKLKDEARLLPADKPREELLKKTRQLSNLRTATAESGICSFSKLPSRPLRLSA
jgi:hypothetical protein